MKRTALAAALAILAWAPLGHADYLEVRRHAHIKRGAERSSETLVELPIGTLVELRHEPQTNGYYKVRTRDRKNGYVYRTLVRRHRGDLPPAPPPVSPVEDEDTAPAPIADDTTPGVPSRPFDPNEPLGSGGIPEMRAHLINVGQGASMLLEFECGTALIDTGGEKNGSLDSESALSGHLETFFGARPALSRTIDLLVITHPAPRSRRQRRARLHRLHRQERHHQRPDHRLGRPSAEAARGMGTRPRDARHHRRGRDPFRRPHQRSHRSHPMPERRPHGPSALGHRRSAPLRLERRRISR
jgi:hypothetical protein